MKSKFNKVNHNIGWSQYSWNPVTGCLGPTGDGKHCPYCYAKKMAERFNQGFEPTFHSERLDAPQNTPVPKTGNTRVFVCSMGELFGPWVPDEWIERVFIAVSENPQWTFLFLTKFPEQAATLNFPGNAWIGATIDRQERAAKTIDTFLQFRKRRQLRSNKLFLSCEPLLEKIDIPELGWLVIDWLIIGALSKGTKKVQPDPAWVEILLSQARKRGVPVWMKDNLTYCRIQEVPQEPIILGTRSKTETRIAG